MSIVSSSLSADLIFGPFFMDQISDVNYVKVNVSRSYISALINESNSDVDCVKLNMSAVLIH